MRFPKDINISWLYISWRQKKCLTCLLKVLNYTFLRGCVRFELPADFNPEEIAAELQSIFAKTDEREFTCSTAYCHSCPYAYFCKKSLRQARI